MTRTFFTADQHFGHQGILSEKMNAPRPFATVAEHDETLVACWNAVVRPDDAVWHLGEFAYRCKAEHALRIFRRLNGRKFLIRGNPPGVAELVPGRPAPLRALARQHAADPEQPGRGRGLLGLDARHAASDPEPPGGALPSGGRDVTRRLWIFSDLHQDWAENAWDPAGHAPAGGFDTAVVAGDVHMPLLRALDWLAERLPGVPLVYVPGNHDFWWHRGEERYTIHDQIARGPDRAAALGITLLMDDVTVIDGTRYLGGTLWTDFLFGSFSRTHAFRTAQGRDGMVDYRRIRTGPRSRNRIEPGEVLAMHRATRAFVSETLAVPHSGTTVVVTHHAPHPDTLPNRHAHLAWCDVSDLSGLIVERGPELWVHGHVHHHADYLVGRTRIICNARGHVDEITAFDPGMVVPVGTA